MAYNPEPQEFTSSAVQGQSYPLPWRYLAASEHSVSFLDAEGLFRRELVFGVDYSISPEGDTARNAGALTLIATPASGEVQLRVRGEASPSQQVTPAPGTEAIVAALDRISLVVDQLQQALVRVDVPSDIEAAKAAALDAAASAAAAAVFDPANYQPKSDKLLALDALTWAADKFPIMQDADEVALADISPAGQSFVALPSVAAQRSALGVDPSPIDLAPIVTVGGSAAVFSGIPATAKEIIVQFNGVAHSNGQIEVWLGTVGGLENSGYDARAYGVLPVSVVLSVSSTGFVTASSTGAIGGVMVLRKGIGNFWYSSWQGIRSDGAAVAGSGVKSLSGPLTQLAVITTLGNFTGGTARVQYK